jgi:hypothetical protein
VPQSRIHAICPQRGKWRRVYHRPAGRFYEPFGWVCTGCHRHVTDEKLDQVERMDSPLRRKTLERRRRGVSRVLRPGEQW